MAQVIGVRFREASRIYHFAPPAEEIFVGEYVVVETPRGLEMGHVVTVPDGEGEPPRDVKPIVRLASSADRDQALRNQERAMSMLARARSLASAQGLDLYLAAFQLNLDGSEATGYFHADSHVNFRELTEALESEFDLRVQMQHAGPRDRAKLVDGYDLCGLRLCCSSWMTEFPRVGIRMAKEQDLALNPDKISGVCGRLLCCLTFEFDVYKEMRGTLPKMGKKVSTPAGMGKVVGLNPLAQEVTILMEEERKRVTVPADQIGLAVRVEEAPNQALVEEQERQREGERERPRGPARRRRRRDPGTDTAPAAEPSETGPADGERDGERDDEGAERRPRRRRRRRRGQAAEGESGATRERAEPAERRRAEGQSEAEGVGGAAEGEERRPRRRRRRRRRRGSADGGEGGSGGAEE